MREASDVVLDRARFLWFSRSRSKGDPISCPLLQEKALELNEKLGGSADFKAGYSFKTKHTIREEGFVEIGEKQIPIIILDSSDHHNKPNIAKREIQSSKIPESFHKANSASSDNQNWTSVKFPARMHRRHVLSPDYAETEGSTSAEILDIVNGEDNISPNHTETDAFTTDEVSENVNSEN
ncbi:hypothetical protein TNCV_3869211, partial [Trichonephila clavipes]